MHIFHKYERIPREEAFEKIHGGNWCPYGPHDICVLCGRIGGRTQCSANGAYYVEEPSAVQVTP